MNRKHTGSFLSAGLVVLLIATFTVSFRAIRAAQRDLPAEGMVLCGR
jgi:hypothetical protein